MNEEKNILWLRRGFQLYVKPYLNSARDLSINFDHNQNLIVLGINIENLVRDDKSLINDDLTDIEEGIEVFYSLYQAGCSVIDKRISNSETVRTKLSSLYRQCEKKFSPEEKRLNFLVETMRKLRYDVDKTSVLYPFHINELECLLNKTLDALNYAKLLTDQDKILIHTVKSSLSRLYEEYELTLDREKYVDP